MSRRSEPFLNGSLYHVFSKTIDGKKIFDSKRFADYFLEILFYYRSTRANISFSKLRKLKPIILDELNKGIIIKKYFQVEIVAFCLMPTHFHLLIKQKVDRGVSKYMANVLNSLTRYFNILHERKGPIFLPKFKSVRIKTDEQFTHVSRYIHLNPYSSGIVENISDLENYPWSSMREYIHNFERALVNPKPILDLFDGSKENYKIFVYDRGNYQKTLEVVKHIEKW